jgi:hypothetical protein
MTTRLPLAAAFLVTQPPPAVPVPATAQYVADVLRRVAHETVVALTPR